MARLRKTFAVYYCGLIVALTSTAISATQTLKLSSGYDIPVVGLGTWQIKPEDMDVALTSALENGYRHIDTAFVYQNEEAIGKALKKWFDKGGKREDLFITAKLPFFGNRPSEVENCLKKSLMRLGLQYVDMYLIHAPVGAQSSNDGESFATDADGNIVFDYGTNHIAIWKAMEDQVKAGRVKSIGLSNFNQSQILNIINNSEIKPSNLQVELQAYNQQKSLCDFCAKNNIVVTGYSTLGSPGTTIFKQLDQEKLPSLLKNPVVQKIAKAHNKTTAQVLLRHAVQNGLVVIPKSTNPKRIKENISIFDFELTSGEMDEMNKLDKSEEGRLFDFKIFKGFEKHPEYPFNNLLKKN